MISTAGVTALTASICWLASPKAEPRGGVIGGALVSTVVAIIGWEVSTVVAVGGHGSLIIVVYNFPTVGTNNNL